MTKRIVNLDTGFEDQDLLRDIRREFLNKLAVKVKDIGDTVYSLDERAVVSATADIANKEIVLHRDDPNKDTVISLDGMFPETVIPDFVYPIKREDGSSINDIQTLKIGKGIEIAESHPSDGTGGTLELTVPSPWAKVGAGTYTPVKNFTVIDPNGLSKIDNDTLTWVIPKDYGQFTGKIGDGQDRPIDQIQVIGNTSESKFDGTTLQISIPDGGSGTVTAEGYFRGFFESLGDVESKVQDPTPGKTFVFVKDKLLPGDKYYTPYFFVNNSWTEVPTDPAITYTAPSSSQTQGVFSIKPDSRIKIDANGQLDLSGLATDEAKLNFHGFYDTQEQLTAAVPHPVLDKSFAYVKHSSGPWVGKVYRNTGAGNSWQLMVPMGTVSLVESSTSIGNSAPIYGIAKNDDWEMKGNGILELKSKDAELKFEVTKIGSSDLLEGDFKTIQFRNSRSNVFYNANTKKLSIEHPQQVIEYNPTFESEHNEDIYKGNIFYDETSRCWMGWGTPETAGGVDVKWTRIAHPKMSDEVKDLSKRLPVKAPNVVGGVTGDDSKWQYTGWTYVDKADPQLPDEFKERCGAYISTVIQDIANDTPRPQERLQICYADEPGGHCYVRRWFKGTDMGTTDQGWKPWVKISMSGKDISDHDTNPNAHRNHMKFYKVGTIDLTIAEIKAKNGIIFDSDLMLLADSDGSSTLNNQYTIIPYDGTFRFGGRLEMDGWGNVSTFPTPTLFVYVYRTRGSVSEIVGEFSYEHKNHKTHMPPMKWATGGIALQAGDKIHFEMKYFGTNPSDTFPNLAFVPARTYFLIEDSRTWAGTRIAKTFERTLGSLNAQKAVGVNVHYSSGTSGAIRVYGVGLPAQVNMTHIKG